MKIAFVSLRYPQEGMVGGAETLLHRLATEAASAGIAVDFLTTCARNHHTWQNEIPAGKEQRDGLHVYFFPVNADRDAGRFHELQVRICQDRILSTSEQEEWMKHSVNSDPLIAHLRENANTYDAILGGPYLFGLIRHALLVAPERSLLIPCLHDEAFARQPVIRNLFHAVAGALFNAEPERDLAARMMGFPLERARVVGMTMDPFEVSPERIRTRLGFTEPYVVYAGRRELLKGTPLLVDYIDTFRQRTGRDIRLVMTGSGAVDIPETLRPYFTDLGFVDETTKHDAMAGALAFVHPSVNESFGIVLLEAWLAGVPALVHASGEVLAWQCRMSKGGLWFRNYPEFERQLLLLADHAELRSSLARAGRTHVLARYGAESVRHRFLEALQLVRWYG